MMTTQETYQLLQGVLRAIDDIEALLASGQYEALPDFNAFCQEVAVEIRDIPASETQMFSTELERIGMRLGQLRDQMVQQRDQLRQDIQGSQQSQHAAKAYVKSSLASTKKKS